MTEWGPTDLEAIKHYQCRDDVIEWYMSRSPRVQLFNFGLTVGKLKTVIAEVERLREMLGRLEWCVEDDGHADCCFFCGGTVDPLPKGWICPSWHHGHKPDCELARALGL